METETTTHKIPVAVSLLVGACRELAVSELQLEEARATDTQDLYPFANERRAKELLVQGKVTELVAALKAEIAGE